MKIGFYSVKTELGKKNLGLLSLRVFIRLSKFDASSHHVTALDLDIEVVCVSKREWREDRLCV